MAARKKRRRPAPRDAAPRPSRPRPAAAPPPAPPSGRRARLAEAPPAPWHPFPLVELTILGGIVLLVLGLTGVGHNRVAFVICGFALVAVASLELSLREHFAGYRSHSTLLAASAAALLVAVLYALTGLPKWVLIAIGVAVFTACFAALRTAFARRTGGLGFRA